MSPSNRQISVRDLCTLLKVEIPSDLRNVQLSGISTLQAATDTEVGYVQKSHFANDANQSKAALVIAHSKIKLNRPNVIYVRDVMDAVITVLDFFHPAPAVESFVHPSAVLGENVKLGPDVFIGPQVVIGNDVVINGKVRIDAHCVVGDRVVIGNGTRLYPRVTLLDDTIIGQRVIIHSGAVLGADGFRFEITRGRLCKIPQVGRVVIEDDVEIGANTTIDRASLTETRIGARTKIDNLVQIGHNVTIASDCIIVAQTGIAGSAKVGRGTMIGGQSGIKDHTVIGNGCRIGGRSGVQCDMPDGSNVMGNPAIDVKDYARFTWFYKNFNSQWDRLKIFLQPPEEKGE